jgi:zinc/manganese transport system permease protein
VPAIATFIFTVAILRFHSRLGRLGFYLLFALSVTISVQLVGVYLVFASLIVPGLAVRNHPQRRRLPLAYVVGVAGYGLGLSLSTVYDLPSGALIVWCLALLAVAVYAAGPSTALLPDEDERASPRLAK